MSCVNERNEWKDHLATVYCKASSQCLKTNSLNRIAALSIIVNIHCVTIWRFTSLEIMNHWETNRIWQDKCLRLRSLPRVSEWLGHREWWRTCVHFRSCPAVLETVVPSASHWWRSQKLRRRPQTEWLRPLSTQLQIHGLYHSLQPYGKQNISE